MCIAVIAMVFIGGLTRLKDSGLSITEWKPITGIIPPIGDLSWESEFNNYQKSPEYQKINNDMSLVEFKSIFWLEYIHRNAGRLTVLLFIIPLVFFIFSKRISKREIPIYLLILILLLMQGVMGWYMVKSGLVENPNVSHYRLAMHMILAVFIFSLILWKKMQVSFEIMLVSETDNIYMMKRLYLFSLLLVYFQIFIGAMVAGLNAGLVYNSFPLMGDGIIPDELFSIGSVCQMLSDPVAIQFLHRVVALILFIMVFILFIVSNHSNYRKLKLVGLYVFLAAIIQLSLGIATLIYFVPLYLALAHQICSLALLSSLLWGLFLIKNA